MAPPYQISDWYGGRPTCHTASGATGKGGEGRWERGKGRKGAFPVFLFYENTTGSDLWVYVRGESEHLVELSGHDRY